MIPLRRAIALLEVSVSGYYKWLLSDKEHKNGVIHSDIEVLIAVKDVIKDSNNTVPIFGNQTSTTHGKIKVINS